VCLYHTVVLTTGRTLLAQANLVVKRPLHTADGRDCYCSHNTLQAVERATSTRIDIFCLLISGFSFTTSRISSFTSVVVDLGHPLLATQCAKFPCSQMWHWILTNVILSGRLHPGYLFFGTNKELPRHYCLPNCT
jgi:hypothetical protein